MQNLLANAYTDRDFEYLKSKGLDVCIAVRDKRTKEVTIRSSVPVDQVKVMLDDEGGHLREGTWLSEAQRGKFPKSPGPLEDILNNKSKLQKFVSKIMGFWNDVRGRQGMGVGTFEAWDSFMLDMGQAPLLVGQLDKARDQLKSFSIKMSDVIEWQDLYGIHGIGTGNLKKVKVSWTWVEVLKFLVIWSYAVAGISIANNVNQTWTPGADDFEESPPKFKVNQMKRKEATKHKCTPIQKDAGKKKGIQRAKAAQFKTKQEDYELAMALSVSEEIEKIREGEKERERNEIAKALSLSLAERSEENQPPERLVKRSISNFICHIFTQPINVGLDVVMLKRNHIQI